MQTWRSMHSLVACVGDKIERLARRHAAIHAIQRRLHVLSPVQVRRALVSGAEVCERADTTLPPPPQSPTHCASQWVSPGPSSARPRAYWIVRERYRS